MHRHTGCGAAGACVGGCGGRGEWRSVWGGTAGRWRVSRRGILFAAHPLARASLPNPPPAPSCPLQVDLSFLDSTFYSPEELGRRDLGDVPHPLVTDTAARLQVRTSQPGRSTLNHGPPAAHSELWALNPVIARGVTKLLEYTPGDRGVPYCTVLHLASSSSSSSSSSVGVQELLPMPPTVLRPGLGA